MDLIAAVAEETDLSRAKAGEVVDAVFAKIAEGLKSSEVRLIGFGTGRNPRTGEEIKIPASTSVRFKPGKALKDAVN
jgi:DNA-binding protein HU-beta